VSTKKEEILQLVFRTSEKSLRRSDHLKTSAVRGGASLEEANRNLKPKKFMSILWMTKVTNGSSL
jgi:hypothetical protein